MHGIDIYVAVMIISALIIVSYIFILITKWTRIPSVLLLLGLGVGIHYTLIGLDLFRQIPIDFIQFFGVLGLVLVLLEAGLDLNLSPSKIPLMKKSLASSIFILTLSVLGIASIFHLGLGQSWHISFVYAVPLSVISSTIVASSIYYLSEKKREFLTYESALSDIFGILLFNFLIAGEIFNLKMLALDVISFIAAVGISIAVSLLLILLLVKVDIHIRAFLVFAVLMLVYSLGHIWHLPTLITILVFGLIINNWTTTAMRPLKRFVGGDDISKAIKAVKNVTSEVAFLIRTVFFVMFGYMIDISVLGDTKVIIVGSIIVATIFITRLLYLMIFSRDHILPELFFAPRGLVTIVIYYSIPASLVITGLNDGILFFVIVVTTLIMMIGSIWFTPKRETREAEERSKNMWSRWLKTTWSHHQSSVR